MIIQDRCRMVQLLLLFQGMVTMSKQTTTGIGLITLSALAFGSYGTWARLMSGSFGAFSQAWIRGVGLLAVIGVLLFVTGSAKKIKRADWPWFGLISLAGLNQAPYYFGFEYLTVGTATLLFYAALVMGGYLIGKVVFNEHVTMVKVLSLVIGIVGIGVIYGFSLSATQLLPATATVLAGFMGAMSAVLPKKLSQDYSELQIMAGWVMVMIVGNLVVAWVVGDTLPDLSHHIPWLAQGGYTLAMLVANVTVIAGFKYLDATIGSLAGLTEILFAGLFGYVLFSEQLTRSTWIGGVLIVTAAVLPHVAGVCKRSD